MSIINNLSDKIDWDNHKCKSNNYNPLMWIKRGYFDERTCKIAQNNSHGKNTNSYIRKQLILSDTFE